MVPSFTECPNKAIKSLEEKKERKEEEEKKQSARVMAASLMPHIVRVGARGVIQYGCSVSASRGGVALSSSGNLAYCGFI